MRRKTLGPSSGSLPDLHLSVPVAATAVIIVIVDVPSVKPLVLLMMLFPVFSTVAIPAVVLVARVATIAFDEITATVRRHYMDHDILAEVATISIAVAPEGLGRGYEQ